MVSDALRLGTLPCQEPRLAEKNDDVLGVESVMVFITSPFSNWVMREVIYQSLDYNYRLIETAAPIKVQLDDPIEARRDLSRS